MGSRSGLRVREVGARDSTKEFAKVCGAVHYWLAPWQKTLVVGGGDKWAERVVVSGWGQ